MSRVLFWFRRDLRLEDNKGLTEALRQNTKVLPIFIFDESIISELPNDDPRINFIYDCLMNLDDQLKTFGSGLLIRKGKPLEVFKELAESYEISAVYSNRDYEPYAIQRDKEVQELLQAKGIGFYQYKDQVIFEQDEVVKDDGLPYHVFTPFKNKWLKKFDGFVPPEEPDLKKFDKQDVSFPTLDDLGFTASKIKVKPYSLDVAGQYELDRNYPYKNGGTYLGPHLRFGTVSVRYLMQKLWSVSQVLVSELIWREFFMQILYHYPNVVHKNFKSKYDAVTWRNDKADFERWCQGETGYPMVDAGMRELNSTGYMHNRVRMITAGFLCKHLLIDWRWGEAYFASKLLDYELSSNNGNWQWAAGTGCDAAPYFRIFNPSEQLKKFDKQLIYVRKWVPEFDSFGYPEPMIDHKFARERALNAYKIGLGT